jgi:DNA-binding transcriptional MerR regulator
MSALLTIGEFARATHLSIKALRHYDDIALLTPAEVDAASGYRHYSTSQVPTALLIRRFRDLEMPIDQVRQVLDANDRDTRDAVIVAHLEQMQQRLEETQALVSALHTLLTGGGATLAVEFRHAQPTTAVAMTERVAWDDVEPWLGDAFARLHEHLESAGIDASGPDGALYTSEFFDAHQGAVTAFVPLPDAVPLLGIEAQVLPAVPYAVVVHTGPFDEIDQAYAALGTYIAERMIGAEGPVRENYLPADEDERTEVCWPVLRSEP